jgi:hypothetical protein
MQCWGMAQGPGGTPEVGWAKLRPVMVGASLVADAGIVLVLGIGRHKGWLPPFIGFGIVLIGLVWFFSWSLAHRHDDDPES